MHEEAFKKEAAALFPRLAEFGKFYLVGGTALALQIGHRRSVDFDLFFSEPLSSILLRQVKRVFSGLDVVVTYRAFEQLNIIVNGVKITFFYFEYPVIDKLIRYKGISLLSVREIAAMKAFAIGRRLSYKDYIDWYFLLKEGYVRIDEVLKLANKKFGNDFNDRLFLGQIVSLSDIPTQKIDFLRNEVDKKTIEKFLKSAVRGFLNKI